MLIEPASNVSVPLTVVMRTRSNVPPRARMPLATLVSVVEFEVLVEQTQVFPEMLVIIEIPDMESAAAFDLIPNPVVKLVVPTAALITDAEPAYPVVTTEPAPI